MDSSLTPEGAMIRFRFSAGRWNGWTQWFN